MSNEQLYIPKTIKVGYQDRDDCYTKKLGYVIYYDDKNTLRKETSWKSWIRTDLGDMENVPMEGFVLNRGAGGQRESYGWNTRNEYIRVYDPRGFEIEISVSNLLFILQETSSIQGKGLEGEFIYSWSGKELVLLPTCAQDYKASQEYTELQGKKVGARDLQVGCAYLTKKQETLIYMGRFEYIETESKYNYNTDKYSYDLTPKKGHIFYDEKNDESTSSYSRPFYILKSMVSLAMIKDETQVSNYADLMDKFNATKHSAAPKEIVLEDVEIPFDMEFDEDKHYWGVELGTFAKPTTYGTTLYTITEKFDHDGTWETPKEERKYISQGFDVDERATYSIQLGKFKKIDGKYSYRGNREVITKEEVRGMGLKKAFAVLTNGNKAKLETY